MARAYRVDHVRLPSHFAFDSASKVISKKLFKVKPLHSYYGICACDFLEVFESFSKNLHFVEFRVLSLHVLNRWCLVYFSSMF
jgi:hypothetical protein